MAKDKEKKTAHILFVAQGKTRKEIAALIGTSERTVGSWVDKYGWLKERTARNASPVKRSENIKSIITSLSEERIELTGLIKEAETKKDADAITDLRTRISKIDDAVAKWNKTFMTIDAENSITLSVYITVMERIFDSLRSFDSKLFMQTIEFQDQHLHKITIELG
jgi:transposase